MNQKEEAVTTFNKGFNCCQAVLSVFCEELNMDKEMALKIGTGFGGGLRKGEVCGAVSGAVMVIGLKYGHCIEGDIETKKKANSITRELVDRFEEKNGSIICKELLGYDLSDEQQYQTMVEQGLFQSKCPLMIQDAIDILNELI